MGLERQKAQERTTPEMSKGDRTMIYFEVRCETLLLETQIAKTMNNQIYLGILKRCFIETIRYLMLLHQLYPTPTRDRIRAIPTFLALFHEIAPTESEYFAGFWSQIWDRPENPWRAEYQEQQGAQL